MRACALLYEKSTELQSTPSTSSCCAPVGDSQGTRNRSSSESVEARERRLAQDKAGKWRRLAAEEQSSRHRARERLRCTAECSQACLQCMRDVQRWRLATELPEERERLVLSQYSITTLFQHSCIDQLHSFSAHCSWILPLAHNAMHSPTGNHFTLTIPNCVQIKVADLDAIVCSDSSVCVCLYIYTYGGNLTLL